MTKARRYFARKPSDTPAGTPDFTSASRVLMDRRAPADERADAEAVAAQATAPFAKGIDPDQMLAWAQRLAKAEDANARRAGAAAAERLIKPLSQGMTPGMAKQVVTLSPEESRTVWLQRPVGLDFPRLRHIIRNDVVLRSIIWTRISQVTRFLTPSQDEWKPGFRLRYRDPNRQVNDSDADRFWWLTQYVMNSGAEFNTRRRRMLKRDGLVDFTAKHLQDSLALDAAPVEIVPTLSGRTHGWVAVDGGRTYLTDPVYGLEGHEERPELMDKYGIELPDAEQTIAILTREGRIQAWYTHDDLLYPVRRPTSDHSWMGYGQPEVEELIRVVTAFLNAMELNARGFTHNSIPQGILTLFGDFADQDIQQLREEWDAWTSGVSNRWRLPVLVSKERESGATFVGTGQNFTEMMFSRWMTFLVSLKTALYLMDPEEINFDAFTSRGASLSGSDTEERITSSKDKGLYPLLTFYGNTLNELVQTVDEEVELYWTGLLPDQQSMKQDEGIGATFGEFRLKRGLPLHPVEILNDAPLNPGLQGIYMQAAQPQQPMAGPPPAGGDADEDGNRVMMDGEGNPMQVMPGQDNPEMQQEQGEQPQTEPQMPEDESVMGKAVSHDGQASLWWP